jgi:hypothetical protein
MRINRIGLLLLGALVINVVQSAACGGRREAVAGPGGSSTSSGSSSTGGSGSPNGVSVSVPCQKYTDGVYTGAFALHPYPGLSNSEIVQRVTAFASLNFLGNVLTKPGEHPLVGGLSQVLMEVTSDGYAAVDCELISSDQRYSAVTFTLH